MELQWECKECGWRGLTHTFLRAANPWNGADMYGCPQCYEIEPFINMCDEPGCGMAATCGTPYQHGKEGTDYRRTCGKHIPKGWPVA